MIPSYLYIGNSYIVKASPVYWGDHMVITGLDNVLSHVDKQYINQSKVICSFNENSQRNDKNKILFVDIACIVAVIVICGVKICFEYPYSKCPSFLHEVRLHMHHDDVIEWKHFPRCWPFVWGIHRSPANSPHKGQWCGCFLWSVSD